MSDRKMLNMIENGIRRGLSYVSTRYMKPGPQRFLVYIDQNNLYGSAQSYMMPIDDYKWVDGPFDEFYYKWKYWHGNETFGWILEVDLKYPPGS